MKKRIELLCSLLFPVSSFADVGCDHGYCSEYMLSNGLCEDVIISDVSRGSLKKAETLLSRYVKEGKCRSNLGDGLRGIPKETELVLIAGMGGMEIVSILKEGFLPKNFVFQPMKNTKELRQFLLANGAGIERDFTFFDEKYYDVLCGTRKGDTIYSPLEYEFGRENLRERSADFLAFLAEKNKRDAALLKGELPVAAREEICARVRRREEVLRGCS